MNTHNFKHNNFQNNNFLLNREVKNQESFDKHNLINYKEIQFEKFFDDEFFFHSSLFVAIPILCIEAFLVNNFYNLITYFLPATIALLYPFIHINKSKILKIRFFQKLLGYCANWLVLLHFPLVIALCIVGK